MDDSIFSIAIQTFNTLTELCQGPCLENQAALVALNVTGDVNKVLRMDFRDTDAVLVFELRCAATLTLLSLLEGCNDPARPKLMVSVIDFASVQRILDALWDRVKDNIASGSKIPDDEQVLPSVGMPVVQNMCQPSGNANNPAARTLGSDHGTREIVPFVNRTFEWGVAIATLLSVFECCAAPLCPLDLLPSPKNEGN